MPLSVGNHPETLRSEMPLVLKAEGASLLGTNQFEANVVTRTQFAQYAPVGAHDRGDHGVATDGGVIGHQHDGLSVGWDLDGASDHPTQGIPVDGGSVAKGDSVDGGWMAKGDSVDGGCSVVVHGGSVGPRWLGVRPARPGRPGQTAKADPVGTVVDGPACV